jgi:death-on-curing protein
MKDPTVWLTKETLSAIHNLSLSRFGGRDGIRDEALLERLLQPPVDHDSAKNLIERATVYCSGLVKSHTFIDGNKPQASWLPTLF